MERKYGIDYDAIVRWERWNTCLEVIKEISHKVLIRRLRYLPSLIPSAHLNAIAALGGFPQIDLHEVHCEQSAYLSFPQCHHWHNWPTVHQGGHAQDRTGCL